MKGEKEVIAEHFSGLIFAKNVTSEVRLLRRSGRIACYEHLTQDTHNQ